MANVNPKIIDLINDTEEKTFVSLEYFPPRTEDGVKVGYSTWFSKFCSQRKNFCLMKTPRSPYVALF